MKAAIMQPYIFPYIGYLQLIRAVDVFVVYDEIEYSKKGWINRNRMLTANGGEQLFTLPLKKGSDYLYISQRELADNFSDFARKIKGQVQTVYSKSPFFSNVFPLISSCFNFQEKNLFLFIFHALQRVCEYLGITTQFLVYSSLAIDPTLKSQEKVLAIAQEVKASTYVNAIGGQALYDREAFRARNIDLNFIKTGNVCYDQFQFPFVPNLSIIDVLMFNSPERIRDHHLSNYTLI